MRCPYCYNDTNSKVTHTFRRVINKKDYVARYRVCIPCNLPYLTLENGTSCPSCECRHSSIIKTQDGRNRTRTRLCERCETTRKTIERAKPIEDDSENLVQRDLPDNPFL